MQRELGMEFLSCSLPYSLLTSWAPSCVRCAGSHLSCVRKGIVLSSGGWMGVGGLITPLMCLSASVLVLSSGCVPCPPSYLAPPVPEPLWGSVAFAVHGTFWPMPLHWHRGFPVFWHLPLLVCFWTIWAFICLVVSAEIHLVGASVAHHCLVVVYLGGRRRHLKTRSPVLHLV